MDNHLEEMLREDMERKTESVFLPGDMLEGAGRRSQRRRIVRRRLLAGGGALGVVILAAGLVFGVLLPQTNVRSSGTQVAESTIARTSTTTASLKAVDVTFLHKMTEATTVAQGEVLHVKVTTVDKAGGGTMVMVREIWSTGGAKWQYRDIDAANGSLSSDMLFNYTGYIKKYDPTAKTIWQCVDEGLKREQAECDGGYLDEINRMVASGEAVEQGHEQIEGRDAVRIVRKGDVRGQDVFLMDAQTGYPIELRRGEGGTSTAHFDVYEKLPATDENLKVFDIQASYPDARVITNEGQVRGG